jgi:mRNA-degrading endonuclease RelE of RelBE toxin-antitoxin system
MKFQIKLTQSAEEDLGHFKVYEMRVIIDAIKGYLGEDADVENKRRKKLTVNPLAPWELRVGSYRIFYDIEEEYLVKIVAIGYKEHNELLIRGRRVEL